jgi:hypothetical protein
MQGPREMVPVAALTFALLRRDFDTKFALERLTDACDGDLYIFGGSVRDAVLHRPRRGDLDLMVPNGDRRVFEALDVLGVPFHHNSQNHRRYRWNTIQIDVFEPSKFFAGFPTVDEAVAFFDLRINALAVHVATERVIDPLSGVSHLLSDLDPGINWVRWNATPPEELLVLLIRLARLLHDVPQLRLPRRDAERLFSEVMPRTEYVDWNYVRARFPLGRARFVNQCAELFRRG